MSNKAFIKITRDDHDLIDQSSLNGELYIRASSIHSVELGAYLPERAELSGEVMRASQGVSIQYGNGHGSYITFNGKDADKRAKHFIEKITQGFEFDEFYTDVD